MNRFLFLFQIKKKTVFTKTRTHKDNGFVYDIAFKTN